MTKLGIITGLAFEARIVARAAERTGADVQVAAGFGRAGAVRAANMLADRGAAALMSFGIAAGLDPDLANGAAVVGVGVATESGAPLTCDKAWHERLGTALNLRPAALAHAADVLRTAAAKADLRARTGAVAADMESYGVGEVAAARRLPFAVLRVVGDGAADELPEVALRATAPDGSVRIARAVIDALTHPRQIPALVRLGRQTKEATVTLKRLAHFGVARGFFAFD